MFALIVTTFIHTRQDSDSDVSTLPFRKNKTAGTDLHFPLMAANNLPIRTHGKSEETADLGFRTKFVWRFILADVGEPILCADFIHQHRVEIKLSSAEIKMDNEVILGVLGRGTNNAVSLPCKLINQDDGHEVPTQLQKVLHTTVHLTDSQRQNQNLKECYKQA